MDPQTTEVNPGAMEIAPDVQAAVVEAADVLVVDVPAAKAQNAANIEAEPIVAEVSESSETSGSSIGTEPIAAALDSCTTTGAESTTASLVVPEPVATDSPNTVETKLAADAEKEPEPVMIDASDIVKELATTSFKNIFPADPTKSGLQSTEHSCEKSDTKFKAAAADPIPSTSRDPRVSVIRDPIAVTDAIEECCDHLAASIKAALSSLMASAPETTVAIDSTKSIEPVETSKPVVSDLERMSTATENQSADATKPTDSMPESNVDAASVAATAADNMGVVVSKHKDSTPQTASVDFTPMLDAVAAAISSATAVAKDDSESEKLMVRIPINLLQKEKQF